MGHLFKYPEIALRTTLFFFAVVGAVCLVAFFLTCHYYLWFVGVPTLVAFWQVMYRFEIGWRTQRMERSAYR